MYQTEYLEVAEKLYKIYKSNDIFPTRWLTARQLQKLKGGPGLIAKVKNKKGKLSELQPVYFDYVNTMTEFYSCNTPTEWTCKFNKDPNHFDIEWEEEFTNEKPSLTGQYDVLDKEVI